MAVPSIVERDLSAEEFGYLCALERADARARGEGEVTETRLSVIAEQRGAFVGCAVLVVHERDGAPTGWAYLEELYVEPPLRHQGLGSALLASVEVAAYALGVRAVWTRTAGYEAPGFYVRQGYTRCFELPAYFRSGHALVGLRKSLTAEGSAPGLARLTRAGLALPRRAMTAGERARMERGFVEHGLEFGNPEATAERLGFAAVDRGALVGCVSGLAYRDPTGLLPWFVLTNLFVAPSHRGRGLGRELTEGLERRLIERGTPRVWAQVSGVWELGFMRERGYESLSVFERWCRGGAGYVTLAKRLATR